MRPNIWWSRKNCNYHPATDDLNLDNGHRSYCQEGIFFQTVDKMRIKMENDNPLRGLRVGKRQDSRLLSCDLPNQHYHPVLHQLI